MHNSSSVIAALWLAHLSSWQWPTLDQWEKLAKIAAVILGGVWVLMNYWRGRTFKSRLELELSADVQKLDGKLQVAGKVVAKNIGLSKIALENLGSGIDYSVYKQDPSCASGVATTELDFVTDVFKDHEWIEPGETISDEFFTVIIADDSVIALKLRVNQLGRPQTMGRRRHKAAASAEEAARRNTQWSANKVFPFPALPGEEKKISLLKRLMDGINGLMKGA